MLQQLHVKTDEMRALEFQTMEAILKKELAYIRHQLDYIQQIPPVTPLAKTR
jgi:hypothetical protein